MRKAILILLLIVLILLDFLSILLNISLYSRPHTILEAAGMGLALFGMLLATCIVCCLWKPLCRGTDFEPNAWKRFFTLLLIGLILMDFWMIYLNVSLYSRPHGMIEAIALGATSFIMLLLTFLNYHVRKKIFRKTAPPCRRKAFGPDDRRSLEKDSFRRPGGLGSPPMTYSRSFVTRRGGHG